MVRLKVLKEEIISLYRCNFNSTMVRLKACRQKKRAFRIFDFNSTMVRLKASLAFTAIVFSLFQFHYGTIKRKPIQNIADMS